jgi:hypothetical protein
MVETASLTAEAAWLTLQDVPIEIDTMRLGVHPSSCART